MHFTGSISEVATTVKKTKGLDAISNSENEVLYDKSFSIFGVHAVGGVSLTSFAVSGR